MPRFVVLEHDWPELHWDFMLEAGEVLRTWRLAVPPQRGATVLATASFDHRRTYLDYEGPVNGNRGQVVRWDAGTFTWIENEGGHVVVRLGGQRLQGTVALAGTGGGVWSLSFEEGTENEEMKDEERGTGNGE